MLKSGVRLLTRKITKNGREPHSVSGWEEPTPVVDYSYLTIDYFPVNDQQFIVNGIPQLKLRGRVNRPLSVQVTDL